MKIVFMGTPGFALSILRAVHENIGVAAVITQPDRPQGRGMNMVSPPVKTYAVENGIEVLQPAKAGDAAEALAIISPDFILTAAYGQILRRNLLDIPKIACINVHASLLPKYRGASPINAAIINGDTETGITTMLMDEGMDTGDILIKRSTPILPEDTAGSLHDRLAVIGAELAVSTLRDFDQIIPQRQDTTLDSCTKLLKKEDGMINWNSRAVDIVNLIRGCNPWPCAYTSHGASILKIWQATFDAPHPGITPGTVITASASEGLVIAARDACVSVTELQRVGKKRMPVSEFLLGYRIQPGDVL